MADIQEVKQEIPVKPAHSIEVPIALVNVDQLPLENEEALIAWVKAQGTHPQLSLICECVVISYRYNMAKKDPKAYANAKAYLEGFKKNSAQQLQEYKQKIEGWLQETEQAPVNAFVKEVIINDAIRIIGKEINKERFESICNYLNTYFQIFKLAQILNSSNDDPLEKTKNQYKIEINDLLTMSEESFKAKDIQNRKQIPTLQNQIVEKKAAEKAKELVPVVKDEAKQKAMDINASMFFLFGGPVSSNNKQIIRKSLENSLIDCLENITYCLGAASGKAKKYILCRIETAKNHVLAMQDDALQTTITQVQAHAKMLEELQDAYFDGKTLYKTHLVLLNLPKAVQKEKTDSSTSSMLPLFNSMSAAEATRMKQWLIQKAMSLIYALGASANKPDKIIESITQTTTNIIRDLEDEALQNYFGLVEVQANKLKALQEQYFVLTQIPTLTIAAPAKPVSPATK